MKVETNRIIHTYVEESKKVDYLIMMTKYIFMVALEKKQKSREKIRMEG
jgi:hypothetical protein